MKIIIFIALILGILVSCNSHDTKSITISETNIEAVQVNNTMDEEIIKPTHGSHPFSGE